MPRIHVDPGAAARLTDAHLTIRHPPELGGGGKSPSLPHYVILSEAACPELAERKNLCFVPLRPFACALRQAQGKLRVTSLEADTRFFNTLSRSAFDGSRLSP